MFNDEGDELVRGEAAAKVGDREEARYYLQWVLDSDAGQEQQSDAWYWLSRCTDDVAERRDCLENVLAASPGYPEARHDLAILEGRLKQSDVMDWWQPTVPLLPLVPPSMVSPGAAQQGSCPRCGAKMAHNPATGELSCQFCGYSPGASRQAPGESAIQDKDWTATIYTRKGHQWELPTARTLKCSGCGATVSLAPSRVSVECPFCGSPYVVQEQAENDELVQPDGIILFAFDAAEALQQARNRLPGRAEAEAMFSMPKPVYLPFWSFNTTAELHWRRVIVRQQHEIAFAEPDEETGSDGVTNEELLVPGTVSLSQEWLQPLSYDLKALVPYSLEALVDWPAEIYSISAAEASIQANEQAARAAEASLCAMLSAGNSNVQVQNQPPLVYVTSYKLLLLPLWVAQYTYRNEAYTALINGQTGQLSGQTPQNKVAGFMSRLLG